MKRVTFVAALVAALFFSATAFAATTTFNGSVSTGDITFKVKSAKHGTKVLRELQSTTVPIKCKAGKNSVSGVDKLDSLPVKKSGTFDVKLKATDPQFDAKLVWKGTLHGAAASGTLPPGRQQGPARQLLGRQELRHGRPQVERVQVTAVRALSSWG